MELPRYFSGDVVGMPVYSQDGMELGVLLGLIFEAQSWDVLGLQVRFRKEALPTMGIKRPWFKTPVGVVSVDQVSGFGDSIVLARVAEHVVIEGLKQRVSAMDALPALPPGRDDEDGHFE